VTEAAEDVSCDAPKKKDSKLSKEFQGRLSHASLQIKTPLITKYFTTREHADLVPDKSELTENVEKDTFDFPATRTSPKKECDEPSESIIADSKYHLLLYKAILCIVACPIMLPD
jgi:hypothetical protein